MKRWLFITCFGFLLLQLPACGGESDTGSKTTEQAAPVAETTPGTEAGVSPEATPEAETVAAPDASTAPAVDIKPLTGDFDSMLERRYLRALVTYSKTQYYVVNGEQQGGSYEFMKAFETWVNKNYPPKQNKLKFHVVFVPVARDQLLPRLVEGRGDLAMGALTVTSERAGIIDFSAPIASGVKEIAVTGPESPELSSVDDLSGQEVFVRKSSSYWEHLETLNARLQGENKAPVTLRAVPEDLEDEDLLEMLNAGLLSIVIVDKYAAELWSSVFTNIKPRPEVVVNEGGDIAWAMRKGSPKLMETVNKFLETHRQGTTFGNIMIKRYAKDTKVLKSAVTPGELKKYQDMVALFQKYGTQYNMDYLLMMAQGYQESTLDQSVKSPVGAVGIMQLMPATGAEQKVGDIHQMENNIHAGVKYIRFMVDQYFANEPMTENNKILFAFAAYNAGPARVRTLRKAAAEKGLDPNIWFNNVEAVAAEKIGMETVNYVSNIYKYYIAYKLIAEKEEEKKKARESLQN